MSLLDTSVPQPPRVVPAQVNFLTLFNPSFGDTEESEREQIVCWSSKEELLQTQDKNRKTRKDKGKDYGGNVSQRAAAGASETGDVQAKRDDSLPNTEQDEEEKINYRLRQIGLARGMVEFAKNFSNQKAVSCVETQKSRLILHELEDGWWVLASIDLTRLPLSSTLQTQSQSNTPRSKKESVKSVSQHQSSEEEAYEYSAREVASPQLLLAQILRAHRVFLLHHAPSLWDLYNKLGKVRSGELLAKFWEKFVWEWDVLLHGNPAVEVYGTCMKLAGGGELGIGVGEEEWGSGEREVLEGFISRTDGCVELLVGRYGDAPAKRPKGMAGIDSPERLREDDAVQQDTWLGNGEEPGPADGIVFSGTGTLSNRSLATVTQWMETIFKHGEDAYGVGENPSARSRPNRRPKRPKTTRKVSNEPRTFNKTSRNVSNESQGERNEEAHSRFRSPKSKAPDLRRKAIENNASPPGIPAPLVSSVERSLDEAIAKATQRANSKSPSTTPTREKSQEETMDGQNSSRSDGRTGSSWFDAEKMTKVFTLGYGTSWTLSPKGFGDQSSNKQTPGKSAEAEDLLLPEQPSEANVTPDRPALTRKASKPADERLQELDPTPEVSDDESFSTPFLQQLERSIGRFIIGLSGDLENAEFEEDEELEVQPSEAATSTKAQRLFLRTLTVEIARPYHRPSITSLNSTLSQMSANSTSSRKSNNNCEPKTSAAASVDGAIQRSMHYEKMRVAVYVHQPFIFVFLFSLHTPSLTIPSFYRGIHHQLGPLQIPLLKRTDPEFVAERVKEVMHSRSNDNKQNSHDPMSQFKKAVTGGSNTIYDLIYDPVKLTIRTSIPNIPIPTSFSDQSSSRTTTVSGSWYTLGIPIGSMSSSSSPSRSPSRQQKVDRETMVKARAEQWSRIDALNVHQQVLNSFAATHSEMVASLSTAMHIRSNAGRANAAPSAALLKAAEMERTVKTNRGWWVLWMRIVPNTTEDVSSISSHATETGQRKTSVDSKTSTATTTTTTSGDKEAFLVRKSADGTPDKPSLKTGNAMSPGGTGRWLLREQNRDTSSSGSHRTSPNASSDGVARANMARGVGEGVGIDARKWIEGLLTLTQ